MNQSEVLENFAKAITPIGRTLMICQTGSFAYGLNTPESDHDFRGVFLPKATYLYGLKTIEQQKVSGDDSVSHSLRQYCLLVGKQNPTVLETLFIEPLFIDPDFAALREELRKLINKNVFKPYSAYVQSQLKKAQFRQPCEKRKDLIEKYGYDVKFMSHVARLAHQGAYLLRTGVIPVKLDGAIKDLVMSIKTGAVDFKTAVDICTQMDVDLHTAYTESKLPESVDYEKFERDFYLPYILREITGMRLNNYLTSIMLNR